MCVRTRAYRTMGIDNTANLYKRASSHLFLWCAVSLEAPPLKVLAHLTGLHDVLGHQVFLLS